MLDFVDDGFPKAQQEPLETFCSRLEGHPHGGRVEGRIVVAQPKPDGMLEALQMYMKDAEYERWFANLPQRTGITGGKTFIADDEAITAVLAPFEGQALLDLAAHEATEIAHALEHKERGFIRPTDPDEADGLTLYDEYRIERARREISNELGWPEGQIDAIQSLRSVVEEIALRMPTRRSDPPGLDFLGAWLEMARSCVMSFGRASGGSQSAIEDVQQWKEHALIADDGWRPVHQSLDDLFAQPGLGTDELAASTASVVRRPILDYGRGAWRKGF
jgi:hypothetical protein